MNSFEPIVKTAVSTQSFDQENPPHTSAVREFAGGGFISVLRMTNLADAWEMGLVVEVLRLELHGRDSYVVILIPETTDLLGL